MPDLYTIDYTRTNSAGNEVPAVYSRFNPLGGIDFNSLDGGGVLSQAADCFIAIRGQKKKLVDRKGEGSFWLTPPYVPVQGDKFGFSEYLPFLFLPWLTSCGAYTCLVYPISFVKDKDRHLAARIAFGALALPFMLLAGGVLKILDVVFQASKNILAFAITLPLTIAIFLPWNFFAAIVTYFTKDEKAEKNQIEANNTNTQTKNLYNDPRLAPGKDQKKKETAGKKLTKGIKKAFTPKSRRKRAFTGPMSRSTTSMLQLGRTYRP